jgi:hypothetical protein
MPREGRARLVGGGCTPGGVARTREKLVRERGAGSGERGAGSRDFISNFFEILTTMARQTYYRG